MMALMIIIALCNLVTLVTAGHTWSQLVTLVTVKDLNNNSLYGIYYQFILVTDGHTWSHWSLSRSGTSTMMALMFITALMATNWELFKKSKSKSEKINLELLDLLALPQVKTCFYLPCPVPSFAPSRSTRALWDRTITFFCRNLPCMPLHFLC